VFNQQRTTNNEQRTTNNKHQTPNNKQRTKVTLFGTSFVYREFIHFDDMVDGCGHNMKKVGTPKLYDEMKQTHINIGTGID